MNKERQAYLVKTSLRRFTVHATSPELAASAVRLQLMTGEEFDYMRNAQDVSYDKKGKKIDWNERIVPMRQGRTWV